MLPLPPRPDVLPQFRFCHLMTSSESPIPYVFPWNYSTDKSYLSVWWWLTLAKGAPTARPPCERKVSLAWVWMGSSTPMWNDTSRGVLSPVAKLLFLLIPLLQSPSWAMMETVMQRFPTFSIYQPLAIVPYRICTHLHRHAIMSNSFSSSTSHPSIQTVQLHRHFR